MTKQELRVKNLQGLRDLYKTDFKGILEVGETFDTSRLPKLVGDSVRLITAKAPSFSNVAALNTVNYALAHVICQARVMIDDPVYASTPVGTNYYALTFAKSGGGKSSATNALIGTLGVFQPALQLVENARMELQIVEARKVALKELQKEEPTLTEDNISEAAYMEYLNPLTRIMTSAKSSRGGIAGILTSLQKESLGSLSVVVDELGMTIQNSKLIGEVIEILTEIFDLAVAEAPAYKTADLQEESVEGVYTNLLAHTSPHIVFTNQNVKGTIDTMMTSAFARRSWFTFADEHEASENDEVATTLEQADAIGHARRVVIAELSVEIADTVTNAVSRLLVDERNRTYMFSEDAAKLYLRYFDYCKVEGKLAEDSSLYQLEIEGRSWRIAKLCGVWAAATGEENITVALLESAIYFAQWNARYLRKFDRMMHNQPYELLADRLKIDESVPIAAALSAGLVSKATPSVIAETLEAMNSYLDKAAVVAYDGEHKAFMYSTLDIVTPTKTVEGEEEVGPFSMSINMVKDARLFADAPANMNDKQKATWVKQPRTALLAQFNRYRTGLKYSNLINVVTKDTVFNTFKYGKGAVATRPDEELEMYRSNSSIESKSNLVILDIDESPVVMDVIAEFLGTHQYLIATSSNKENRAKFRVLLPVNVELDGSNTAQYAYVVRRICTDLLLEADPKSYCPSQPWYGYLGASYLLQDTGELFDVTGYITEYVEDSKVAAKKLTIAKSPKARKAHVDKLLGNIDAVGYAVVNAPQGRGSYEMAKFALWMVSEGLNAEELENVLLHLNNCWAIPMDENRLYKTVILPYQAKIGKR